MSYTNLITKSIFEIIGDKTNLGYSFKDVPIFLNKDFTTQYPQIRVSPFIDKADVLDQKYIEKTLKAYRHWESGIFQIDIYTKNVIEGQNIYDSLIERIYDFFNLETLIYNWTPNFKEIDTNVYKNIDYALTGDLFKDVYSVVLEKQKLKQVHFFHDLDLDSFYIDEDALYICSKKDLKTLEMKVLLQGNLFDNGDSYSDRGIHYYELSNQRNLSALEDNEVERISFDMFVLYSHRREREEIPKVKGIRLPKPNVR